METQVQQQIEAPTPRLSYAENCAEFERINNELRRMLTSGPFDDTRFNTLLRRMDQLTRDLN